MTDQPPPPEPPEEPGAEELGAPSEDPGAEAVAAEEAGTAPARGRGARTALVLGIVLGVAFLVGAVAVALLDDGTGPGDGEGGVVIESGAGLGENVAATEREPLPEMVLMGFASEEAPPVDLTDYRGAPLLVNFWATWCAPCVREMPDFQRFSEEMGDRVPLLGVNVQDAPANATAFVEELGITYDLASDPAGELYSEVRGFGMPTTLFVDADGMIVYRHTGPLDVDDLHVLSAAHLDIAAR